VMLSPKLLEILRGWWRVEKPKQWLFPGDIPGQHISRDAVGQACQKARQLSGIRKPISPHSLRHYLPSRIMSGRCSVAFIFGRFARNSGDIEIGFLSSASGRKCRRRAFITDKKQFSREMTKGPPAWLLQSQHDWKGRSLFLRGGLLSFISSLRLGQDYVGRIAECSACSGPKSLIQRQTCSATRHNPGG